MQNRVICVARDSLLGDRFCSLSRIRNGSFGCFFQEIEWPVEVVFEYDTYALSSHCIADKVVLVVKVIVGFEPDCSLFVEQILNVEVADECGTFAIISVVAVSEVSVKQEPIVK